MNELQLNALKLLRQAIDIGKPNRSGWYDAQQKAAGFDRVESLPDDQWIKEVQTWEAIAWAAIQIVIADYAIGPTVRDPSSKDLVVKNGTEKELCSMMKMRRPGGFV